MQAQDRCHRIGQAKPVVVYRIVAASTIDHKIVQCAAEKRAFENIVMHKVSGSWCWCTKVEAAAVKL